MNLNLRIVSEGHSMKTVHSSFGGRLFGGANFQTIEVRPEGILIKTKQEESLVSYDHLKALILQSGRFFRTLRFTTGMNIDVVLKGMPKLGTKSLDTLILDEQAKFLEIHKRLSAAKPHIEDTAKWIDQRLSGRYWVANSDIPSLNNKLHGLQDLFQIPASYLTSDQQLQVTLDKVDRVRKDIPLFRSESNAKFIEQEKKQFKTYFDTIESNPLTDSQRLAVITHEGNTRVVAGAGSGKTSVIVAKTGYLLNKGLCTPEQLLLIAFNKSAADEMRARIKQRIGIDVRATTFHALGLGIIGETTGTQPSLAKSAGDHRILIKLVRNIMIELLDDRKASKIIKNYFQSFLFPNKSEADFETLGEYYNYLKKQDLRTLKGEKVKSFEEIEVANFLFLHGVAYEYERDYEINTATAEYRQYQPDFYLPEYNIYLEHFGISRDGSTAPYVDRQEYHEGIRWKRELHKQNNTTLIETFSYMKKEGTLAHDLGRLLTKQGVTLTPISSETFKEALRNENFVDPFSNLIATFLNHYKGNGLTIEKVTQTAKKRKLMDHRLKSFLQVFEQFHIAYEEKLKIENVIDFNDMIIQSARLAESKTYRSPYTCILVDEFQDISAGRARLVSALKKQHPTNKLFCVGDDWQSIYRFAGSDIALMRDFESHFGFTETVYLDHTFRFNNRLEAVATKFILQNPAQISKKIEAIRSEPNARVYIHYPETSETGILMHAIEQVAAEKPDASILLLGRYNFLEDGIPWTQISARFPYLSVNYKTVHTSKGTEADYVILLSITEGRYGFPSEVIDDPILDAVLSEPEQFDYAEERRLFYVALTRARHAVHLISSTPTPSPFLSELAKDERNVNIEGHVDREPVKCSNCETGDMILRTGKHGYFYACSNFPYCTHKARPCTQCGTGYLVPGLRTLKCNNENCNHTERICPRCKTGRLVERKGKYGIFLGCSNYNSGKCNYTENIIS